jgi:putative FmdB family regulatory protein
VPTYLHRCPLCKVEFEVERKMRDKSPVLCPKCDSKTERLIAGCSFVLKGGRWSKDGYGK